MMKRSMNMNRLVSAVALTIALGAGALPALAALPRASLSIKAPLAGATLQQDATFPVTGTLKPRHAATLLYTRVYLYRYHQGAWRRYTYVNARNRRTATLTAFKKITAIPYTGRWMLKAYHRCSKHSASWSAARYVTVNGNIDKGVPSLSCSTGCH